MSLWCVFMHQQLELRLEQIPEIPPHLDLDEEELEFALGN